MSLCPEDTGPVGPRPSDEPDSHDEIRRELIAVRAASHGLMPLVDALNSQRRPVASVVDTARLVEGVKAGSAWNGHTMARLMGLSRASAREHPATSMLLASTHFLGADVPGYDDIVRPRPPEREAFYFDKEPNL